MKSAMKNRELLGLEPFYVLKNLLERQQTNGWGKFILVFCQNLFSSSFSR